MCVIFNLYEKLEEIKSLPSDCHEVWGPRLAGDNCPEPDSSEVPSPTIRILLRTEQREVKSPAQGHTAQGEYGDLNPGSSWLQRAGQEGEEGREGSVPLGFSSPLSPPAQSSELVEQSGEAGGFQDARGRGCGRAGLPPGYGRMGIRVGLIHSFLCPEQPVGWYRQVGSRDGAGSGREGQWRNSPEQ